MTPIWFPQSNGQLNPPRTPGGELRPLRVLSDGERILSCWRLSWRERLSVLLFGRAWLCVSGRHHPPVWLQATRRIPTTAPK